MAGITVSIRCARVRLAWCFSSIAVAAICLHRLERLHALAWMGVDLFLVLSGYLIGTQLLRPYATGSRPLWRDFYQRRFYRVLPAYLAVLLLYVLVPAWREAPHLSPAWQFLTFTENLFVDYAHNQAFSHVWSLCVEEHFYLVLPLLVGGLMLRPSFAKAAVTTGALVLIGIGLRASALHYLLRYWGVWSRLYRADLLPYMDTARWAYRWCCDGCCAAVSVCVVGRCNEARSLVDWDGCGFCWCLLVAL